MGQGTPWVDWAGTLHDLMFIFDTTAMLCHFPFTMRKKNQTPIERYSRKYLISTPQKCSSITNKDSEKLSLSRGA